LPAATKAGAPAAAAAVVVVVNADREDRRATRRRDFHLDAPLDRRRPPRRQPGPGGSSSSRLWRTLASEGMRECCPEALQASLARRSPSARYGQLTFMADQEPA
jgi:hypothetical protein